MKKTLIILIVLFVNISVSAALLEVNFIAKTNLPGVSVPGSLKKTIKVKIGSIIKESIAPEALDTGMEIRNKHMVEEVFNGGKKIKVLSKINKECAETYECYLDLELSINDIAKKLKLKVTRSEKVFKGKTVLKLSDFKIEPPEKFGVRVENEIEVEFSINL